MSTCVDEFWSDKSVEGYVLIKTFIRYLFYFAVLYADVLLTACNLHCPLQWRHNECDGVSNHQPHDCLLNRLFKDNIKAPRHWPLCGEITGDQWIPRTNGQYRRKSFYLMTSSCGICIVMSCYVCGRNRFQPCIPNLAILLKFILTCISLPPDDLSNLRQNTQNLSV